MLRRLALPMTLVAAALLPGCGTRVEMALVDPTKYQFHTCGLLQREMNELTTRAYELRALQAKARQDAAGALVAEIAYQPDYLTTVGNMELVENAARDRDCDPPIVAPASIIPR